MYTCIFTCLYTYEQDDSYVYICIDVYVYTCICIYMYTRTHNLYVDVYPKAARPQAMIGGDDLHLFMPLGSRSLDFLHMA